MHFSQDDAAAVFDTIDTNPKNGKITKMPELQEYLDKTNVNSQDARGTRLEDQALGHSG
jgi:hypothetical protein